MNIAYIKPAKSEKKNTTIARLHNSAAKQHLLDLRRNVSYIFFPAIDPNELQSKSGLTWIEWTSAVTQIQSNARKISRAGWMNYVSHCWFTFISSVFRHRESSLYHSTCQTKRIHTASQKKTHECVIQKLIIGNGTARAPNWILQCVGRHSVANRKRRAQHYRNTFRLYIYGLIYDTDCTLANMKWLPKITRWRIGLFGALFCRLYVFLALKLAFKADSWAMKLLCANNDDLIPYALFSCYSFIFLMCSSLVLYSFTPILRCLG